MKKLTSSFDKEGKSLAENNKQRKLLNEQIENQKDRVKALTDMLKKSEEAYGENADETLRWKQAVYEAEAQLNKLKKELDDLPTSLEQFADKFADIGSNVERVGDKLSDIGQKMTSTITAGVGAAFGASVKAAVDWESAFTGVMKTVDETVSTSYDDIAKSIMKMSTETTSSKADIAAVAEAAGQLGVSADDLEGFVKTMVMLGDTTNLEAEEAASALAKFTNITGSGNGSVDRLGAAIVALGNNFATTEADIVSMSTRLAASGTLAGLTETDILALSTAMSSVGIEAEAGGTAMSQTLKTISNAVADFKSGEAEDLQIIADVAEMRAADFADAWEKDPIQAIQAFVKGLRVMADADENVFAILSDMGMNGIRQTNMIQSLALASDKLEGAINTASEAYEENTALTAEAEKRYGTFAAQMSQLKEEISNIAIVFGNDLLPYVQKGVDFIKGLVEQFSALSEEERGQVIKIAAIAAAIGPLLMGGGKIISVVGKIMQYAPTILTVVKTVAMGLGSLVASLEAIMLPLLTIGAVIGVAIAAFKHLWETNEEFRNGMIGTWNEIKAVIDNFITEITSRFPEISFSFTEIMQVAGEMWDKFCQLLGPTFQAAFDFIKIVLDGILNAIIGVIDMLTGIFTGDKELFMQGLQTFLTSIMNFILQWWLLLFQWFVNTANVFLGWFGTSLGEVITKIIEFFSEIWDKITEKLQEIVDMVIEKITEVCDFIASLPDKFYQWGVDMIQSLIDGIRSMIGAVGEAVMEVAETIASFLHFSEPDKGPLSHFHTFMPDMMKQLAEGMEAGRFKVRVAAANVAADIAAPLGNTSNVTMNNSFSFTGGYTEADGRNIVRQINRQLGALYI